MEKGLRIRVQKEEVKEWIEKLLKIEFFGVCYDHPEVKKNEKNMFCIDCRQSACQHCVSFGIHSQHNLLQIRRYVYADVVNSQDIQKYFSCGKIQTYTTNKARVVFLNARPNKQAQAKSNNGVPCQVCGKNVQLSNWFCSIACKLSQNTWDDEKDSRYPDQNEELSDSSDNDIQGSEFYLKEEDESSEMELSKSTVFRPTVRLLKRKGIPHRAPLS